MFPGMGQACMLPNLVFLMKDNAYIACIRLGLRDLHTTELDFFFLLSTISCYAREPGNEVSCYLIPKLLCEGTQDPG